MSSRCTVVEFDAYTVRRCVLDARHIGGRWMRNLSHQFSDDGDQEVCGRRSTNVSAGTARYCVLPREHTEHRVPFMQRHIYSVDTERPATPEERGIKRHDEG